MEEAPTVVLKQGTGLGSPSGKLGENHGCVPRPQEVMRAQKRGARILASSKRPMQLQ